MRLAILTIVALGWAMQATAQPSHTRTDPDWLKTPSEEDLRGMWPKEALKQQMSGKVRLRCEVDLQGLVQDCSVASEDPPGMGFGSAALALTPKFLFRPATVDGRPVSSWVTVPVNFEFPNGRRSLREPLTPELGTRISGAEPGGRSYYLITQAPWTKTPTEQQLEAAYPARAKPGTVFGHVVLDCQFSKEGDLKTCETYSEEPYGQGFAEAARSLKALFHIDPESAKGVDLSQVHINLAVHFVAPAHRQDRRLIDHPSWASAGEPPGDMFPAKAAKAGLTTGRVVLDCIADAAGRLTGCEAVSEDPAGMDFGPAAVKTAAGMTVNPWTVSGEPADGAHVVFAVRINKDEPAAGKPGS